MPTYVVTGPDGKRYRVSAPSGASEQDVLARVRNQKKPDTRPTSFWEGVKKGIETPFNNAARLLETGAEKIGIAEPLNNLGRALGMAGSVGEAEAAQRRDQSRSQYRPSRAGEFVGNVAGTIPTALVTKSPFVQGALSTGLLTESREPANIGAEMLVGGLIGKGSDMAVRGAANKIAPKVSKALRDITDKGVRVTPGQAARESTKKSGRLLAAFEDRAVSLPGPTGEAVRAGRKRASEDFVRGAVNESLGDLGKTLPKDIPMGHEVVGFAQKAASDAYEGALKGMRLMPDQQLASEIDDLAASVANGSISEPYAKQFRDVIQNEVVRRANANGGNLSGDALKTTLSSLGKKASRYKGSSDAAQQEFGDVLSSLAESLEGAARRSSPLESVRALEAVDRAYAKLVRIEGAAKNTPEGIFSPAQLNSAIRQADSSVRKRAISAGGGLMQDYAKMGQKILGPTIGDSGTAGREAIWNPIAWGVDLGAYIPYKLAERATPTMLRPTTPYQQALAELFRISAPTASRVAPVAGYNLTSGQ